MQTFSQEVHFTDKLNNDSLVGRYTTLAVDLVGGNISKYCLVLY